MLGGEAPEVVPTFVHPNGEQGEVHVKPLGPDAKWLGLWDTSTSPNGSGAATRFTRKLWRGGLDSDLLSGWENIAGFPAARATVAEQVADTECQDHHDTPCYIWHPLRRKHLIYNTYAPGNLATVQPTATGIRCFTIGVTELDRLLEPLNSYRGGRDPSFKGVVHNRIGGTISWAQEFVISSGEPTVFTGGFTEPSVVWLPHKQILRMFVTGITGVTDGAFTWNIGYLDSEDGITWFNPTLVWNPDDTSSPANEVFTTITPGFRGAWQQEVFYDPVAKGIHMLACISNQNSLGKIGYYWSPDDGNTWFSHPLNPVLKLEASGVGLGPTNPGGEDFGHIATPTGFLDYKNRRMVVIVSGSTNARGAGSDWFYAASAPLPYLREYSGSLVA